MTTTDDSKAPDDNRLLAQRVSRKLRAYMVLLLAWATSVAILHLLPILQEIAIIMLALLPWLLVGLLFLKAPLIRATGNRLRGDFGIFLALTASVLWYSSMVELRSVNMSGAMMPALFPALMLCTAIVAGFRAAGASWTGAALAALIAAPVYGFGAVTFVNAFFDRSPSQIFDTRIVEKREGIVKPLAEIKLRAWGPLKVDKWEGYLPFGLWDYALPGTRLCMDLHSGAFSMPWYMIKSCQKERKECVKDSDCLAWLEHMKDELQRLPPDRPSKDN